MNTHKSGKGSLSEVSTQALLARRRRAVSRLGDVEGVLIGSLTEQTRRCGKAGCRCADGAPHGPYVYFAPRTAGRGRLQYVPSGLVATVAARVRRGEQVEEALAKLSAINAELLARRELS